MLQGVKLTLNIVLHGPNARVKGWTLDTAPWPGQGNARFLTYQHIIARTKFVLPSILATKLHSFFKTHC